MAADATVPGTRPGVHYGWVVVAAGTLTVFAAIGLGRFGLGMLLPSMGLALDLDYGEMGFISTGNLVGYLAAVYGVRWLIRRCGARLVVGASLLLCGLSMMAIALSGGFVAALVLFTLTGIGSGLANVPVMALVSLWFARRHRGKAAGWMVMGNGFAIVLAGVLIPAVNAGAGEDGWRLGWIVLGGLVVAAAFATSVMVRNRPADLDLAPVGAGTAGAEVAAAPDPAAARRTVLHLGVIYALFGASYVIYTTFIVTSLIVDHGLAEGAAGSFWAWLGGLSLLSGPVFGALSDRVGRRTGLAIVFVLQMTAYGLAALPAEAIVPWLSVACFGLVAWSVPSIMAAAVGDYLGPDHAAEAFGTVTLIFGTGQIAGPAVAGLVAEAAGGFAASFAVAAAFAGLAVALTLALPPPAAHGRPAGTS
jgi:MFS family permease